MDVSKRGYFNEQRIVNKCKLDLRVAVLFLKYFLTVSNCMQTPDKKKILFGETNSLSLPSKRTAEQSAIKIPKRQFGSSVKIQKDSEQTEEAQPLKSQVVETPTKQNFKLVDKKEEKVPDEYLFTGKQATLYIMEQGKWTLKAKNGVVFLQTIKKQTVLEEDEDGSSSTVEKEAFQLQVIFRDNTTIKKIMLNALIVNEKKVFQMPQQPNSVGFCVSLNSKLETVGILFKDATTAQALISLVDEYIN